MLEIVNHYLVKRYIEQLRRELQIQGLAKAQMEEILLEAQDHIETALTEAQPQSSQDIEKVLTQFGDAKTMAKGLSSEYSRQGTSRPYLWPAGFFLASILVFSCFSWNFTLFRPAPHTLGTAGIQILGKTFFPAGIWSGSLVLLGIAVTLFILGFRARRPVFGQFLAATVVLTLVLTAWHAVKDIPAGYFQGANNNEMRLFPVRKTEYDATLQQLTARLESLQSTDSELRLGQKAFRDCTSPSAIPAEFKYNGLFLTPEAIREHGMGISYERMWPGIESASWEGAKTAWNGRHGRIESRSECDVILAMTPAEMSSINKGIAYLRWIHGQPTAVQLWDDFLMVKQQNWIVCLLAALISNFGWLCWLTITAIGRVLRRFKYGGGSFQQA